MAENLILNPKLRVRNVINDGSNVPPISRQLSLVKYYRSANEMYRMAGVYLSDHDDEAALKLYVRFSSLLLEHLPKHPEYATVTTDQKRKATTNLPTAMQHAEGLKKRLLAKFEQDAEEYQAEQRKWAEVAAQNVAPSAPLSADGGAFDDSSVNTHDVGFPVLDDDGSQPPSYNASIAAGARPDTIRPSIDRSTKPAFIHSNISFSTPSGLRSVEVPQRLIQLFLNAAATNTTNNVETCGVLCGQLAQNQFSITYCVIPKQSGGSDSCLTEKEEEVFEFQDSHDLITIGWIHTHPSQTAFLSSVDLHTHCSYQLMLPEAIAIVCAPTYDQVGTFMLTSVGLSEVESCRQTGFHPHTKVPPIFEDCGHVRFTDNQANLIDLR